MDRQLIVAVLTGEATAAEREAVDAWRSARPENEEQFRRHERLWMLLGDLEPAVSTAPRRRRTAEWAGLAAASLFLGLVLGLGVANRASEVAFGAETVVTGAGEVTTLTLRDGSVVRLGPESRLGFRQDDGIRDVFLDGRAFFAVAPGQDRFRVHTDAGEVTVLGSRFDLRARGDEIRVVTVEGAIEVEAGGRRLLVRENVVGEVTAASGLTVQAVDHVYEETAWLGDFIAFQSTPLADVAREFELRFGVRVEIVDPDIAAHTVTGWFTDQTPIEMVTNVCWVVGADCTIQGQTVLMGSTGHGPPPAPPATVPPAIGS